ncbi:cleavage and polyadenylation specificity factor subunit 6-like [Venturia canescens]|uniref:cleavage and polyadenylation specificity factor subunit 6-like n=1 Tax=Venturia canescens TaxID=32260 RepID=UPI001C9C21BB|nr:cleavage and polyadenylation specificity factor subunit 6-like [Venturia canescens]
MYKRVQMDNLNDNIQRLSVAEGCYQSRHALPGSMEISPPTPSADPPDALLANALPASTVGPAPSGPPAEATVRPAGSSAGPPIGPPSGPPPSPLQWPNNLPDALLANALSASTVGPAPSGPPAEATVRPAGSSAGPPTGPPSGPPPSPLQWPNNPPDALLANALPPSTVGPAPSGPPAEATVRPAGSSAGPPTGPPSGPPPSPLQWPNKRGKRAGRKVRHNLKMKFLSELQHLSANHLATEAMRGRRGHWRQNRGGHGQQGSLSG